MNWTPPSGPPNRALTGPLPALGALVEDTPIYDRLTTSIGDPALACARFDELHNAVCRDINTLMDGVYTAIDGRRRPIPAPRPPENTVSVTVENLENLTVKELRHFAESLGLKPPAKARKNELLHAITHAPREIEP